MVTEKSRRPLDSSELNGSRVPPGPLVEGPSISREAFLLAFSRSFDRIHSYSSLDLLVAGGDERRVAVGLKTSSDQRIEEQTAWSLAGRELEW
jgi:hypothetical protein